MKLNLKEKVLSYRDNGQKKQMRMYLAKDVILFIHKMKLQIMLLELANKPLKVKPRAEAPTLPMGVR
ncbi:MAG: hypothetical protein ACK5RO_06730 [Pseudobdellovibrionaceae bacterium]|nr:hypothetical protein [Pseudanabaena sp. M151S2SP2A07QC]